MCDANYFQTPPDYSGMGRPILISTADVFKSLGSFKWNTLDGGWVNASWFILRPAFPFFSRGFDFNSKRRATHKQVLHQSTTSLHRACFPHFSFTLVYIAALKRRVNLRPAITLMENMSVETELFMCGKCLVFTYGKELFWAGGWGTLSGNAFFKKGNM